MVIRHEKKVNPILHVSTYSVVVLWIINLVIVKCVYMSCLYLHFQENIWFGYYFMQKIETLPLDFYSCSLGDWVWREGKENLFPPFHHMLCRQLAENSGLYLCLSRQKKSLVLEHGAVICAENCWGSTLQSRTITNGQCLFPLFSQHFKYLPL